MKTSFDIINKKDIVDFFQSLIVSESYTFKLDFVFDDGVLIGTDRENPEREIIQIQLVYASSPALSDDEDFAEEGQDYVMAIYLWDSAPILNNAISSNNDDNIDLSSVASAITTSLDNYEANQLEVDYNSAKYNPDTDSSIMAQTNAVTKILITPRSFQKSLDMSTSGFALKSESEAASEEAGRRSARATALADWKTTNGWS